MQPLVKGEIVDSEKTAESRIPAIHDINTETNEKAVPSLFRER